MKIIESRMMDTNELRNVVTLNQWYCYGTDADWNHLLSMVRYKNMTPNRLYRVAKDIFEHSEYTSSDVILDIMTVLENHCTSEFEIREDA